MGNKVWRLIFNLLLMAMLGVFGWYAVAAFLEWAANDTQLSVYFAPTKDPGWLGVLYRSTFVATGGVFGFALGAALFRRVEQAGDRLGAMSPRDKVSLISGLVVGLILTAVVSVPIILVLSHTPAIAVTVSLLLGVAFTYLSTVVAMSVKEEFRFFLPPVPEAEQAPPEKYKLLDTNVIIDGRIADIARAGFLEGPIYVPGFILDELQHIADSSDSLKRARGRRGLEILNAMDKDLHLIVREYDRMAPSVAHEEVDARLVRLAKGLSGSIVTNDFNLNRVATLQGVPVLNVNELANALKPVVLPGEEMQVALVKEGKESSQGVGYLDDGTMIVVENGRRHLGETVDVLVSSVLQTQAGKMIFAHLRDDESEAKEVDRGVRPYTRGGPRRPVRQ